MASILTARMSSGALPPECAYVGERGGVGMIRLEPAAAIVRRYGEQFRRGGESVGLGR
jgi:hypothetical protein